MHDILMKFKCAAVFVFLAVFLINIKITMSRSGNLVIPEKKTINKKIYTYIAENNMIAKQGKYANIYYEKVDEQYSDMILDMADLYYPIISSEMNHKISDEKIDIVNWSENPAILIENALSPSKVVAVLADPDNKEALVVVPDFQLSLAIGKEGQNARLAAKLTGFKIDIKSESQAKEEGIQYVFDDDEYYDDEYYDDEYDAEYDDEYYDDEYDSESEADSEESEEVTEETSEATTEETEE